MAAVPLGALGPLSAPSDGEAGEAGEAGAAVEPARTLGDRQNAQCLQRQSAQWLSAWRGKQNFSQASLAMSDLS